MGKSVGKFYICFFVWACGVFSKSAFSLKYLLSLDCQPANQSDEQKSLGIRWLHNTVAYASL